MEIIGTFIVASAIILGMVWIIHLLISILDSEIDTDTPPWLTFIGMLWISVSGVLGGFLALILIASGPELINSVRSDKPIEPKIEYKVSKDRSTIDTIYVYTKKEDCK